MNAKITVLLVDDHSLVRRGFRRLLEDDPDLEVIGEGQNGEDAIRLAAELSPRVIVMDCAMPGINGLAATRTILQRSPDVAILMLSMHAEETLVRQALEAGARGYVLKNALDLDLASAVTRVAAGETVLDPSVSRPDALKGDHGHGLTPRELEVLAAMADGASNKAIARRLGISFHTAKFHVAAILAKLNADSRTEAVTRAAQLGLVML